MCVKLKMKSKLLEPPFTAGRGAALAVLPPAPFAPPPRDIRVMLGSHWPAMYIFLLQLFLQVHSYLAVRYLLWAFDGRQKSVDNGHSLIQISRAYSAGSHITCTPVVGNPAGTGSLGSQWCSERDRVFPLNLNHYSADINEK